MKKEHEIILDKITSYLSKPGSEHLRFWQALYNLGIIKIHTIDTGIHFESWVRDDHNISDKDLIERMNA